MNNWLIGFGIIAIILGGFGYGKAEGESTKIAGALYALMGIVELVLGLYV